MNLDNIFNVPDPEPEDLSLFEEAYLHAPQPWQPPEDGLSPMPKDFPAEDPAALSDSVRLVLGMFKAEGPCTMHNCARDDSEYLANEIAPHAVSIVQSLVNVAKLLYEHGHELAGEQLLVHTNALSEEVIKPFLLANGVHATSPEDEL